jgi:NAD(P)H-hydrate epimerase
VDADAGAADLAVHADLTIAMGNVKRGHLLARDHCGQVLALDIGVSNEADSDGAPALIDAAWVRARIPSFPAAAHKGTRKRLLLVGAAHGMAGALAYATRAALRSGIGMVRCCCALESIPSLQALVPQATTAPWPAPNEVDSALAWPHALLIGPGLGADAGARSRAQMWLRAWRGPVVVDADGLGCFGPDVDALGALLAGRPAIVTPHATEAARLLGTTAADVLARRFDLAADLARHLNATVLLKGVPTLVAAGDGTRGVIARGTPVLAQGGSGDVLAGIGATLLAQLGDAPNAAACAAFVHGRAAEIATAGRTVRGVTLDDVVVALGQVWRLDDDPIAEGELAWLPGVGAAR